MIPVIDVGPVKLRLEHECWMLYLVHPHFATARKAAICIPVPSPDLMWVAKYKFENAFDYLYDLYEREIDTDLVELCR